MFPMRARPFSRVALLSAGILGLSLMGACAKTDADTKAQADKGAPAAAKSASKDSAAQLSSLSTEQQAAVRALIRDTLVSNPEILLEAQQAYETKQTMQLNERVATAFTGLKKDHAELSFGPANAKITVVEFFDYKCGFCHAANTWVMDLMKTRKDIRVIFKELPILSENSHYAAKAAIAAHKQGKYVAFHQAMMQSRGDLSPEQVQQIAATVGLDVEKLQKDIADPKVEAMIAGVRQQATELGINGTPGFVINGKLVSGFAKDELEATIGAAGIDAPAKQKT
jgi:protein-disulfide isomerase